MSDIIDKMKDLQFELDMINMKLKPQDHFRSVLENQIDDAKKTFAYTNRQVETNFQVELVDLSREKAYRVDVTMDSGTLLKALNNESKELKSRRDEIKITLSKINKALAELSSQIK